MKVGQISFNKLSNKADYLQFDICGCSSLDVMKKILSYGEVPIILHGDWTKKGFSENNLEHRYKEYIKIINVLKNFTNVLGLTLHPPARSKMSLKRIEEIVSIIEEQSNTNVFLENRSNILLNLSKTSEIIEYSKKHKMTIDVPQLYISCNYNQNSLLDTLSKINMNNVKEIHLANIKRMGNHTFVGRKLEDGELDIFNILKYCPKEAFYTLEILGHIKVFEEMKELLKEKI